MRIFCGLAAFLICSAAALGSTSLSYSGASLASGTGAMTITCTDTSAGNLWSLNLLRQSTGYLVQIVNFTDLQGGFGGSYNYAQANTSGQGLFQCNNLTGSSNGAMYAGTFSELNKTSAYYSYRITVTKTISGIQQWRQTSTYEINPATSTNTQFTCQVVTTNLSGAPQTSQTFMSGIFQGWMNLNCDPYDFGQGGALSPYQGSPPNNYLDQLQTGGANAIWQITDNLNAANPSRVAGSPAWGQAQVIGNTASQGQGLIPVRTFKLSSDINNNETAATSFSAALDTTNGDPLSFQITPVNWGTPAAWMPGVSYTHNYTLAANITNIPQPVVAITGADEAIQDTNGSGDGTGTTPVVLNGTASYGGGGIASYTWTWTDTVNGVTTQHSVTGSSPMVNLYSGLYDGYQNLNNGINDITLTVTGNDGLQGSATQRVWVYPEPNYWVNTATGSDSNNGTSQSTPYKTINHAIGQKTLKPGNVIMVMGGSYYETAGANSNGNSTAAGAATSGQITVMGMPLQHVVVDESDPLTNWQPCPATLNGFAVPNYTHIWYTNTAVVGGVNTNINWASTHVTQDNTELVCASFPLASGNPATTGGTPYVLTGGYYVLTGGTASATIVDTTHLQNNSNYPNGFFNGANVVLEETSGSEQVLGLTVSSFVASTGTLNVTGTSFNAPTANKDGYALCNLPQLMNVAGTYADVKQSNGTYNVYVWLTDGSNPATSGHVVTAGHRTSGMYPNYLASYWTFDNLQVRHVEYTVGNPQAFGTGSTNDAGTNCIYQNCLADHNNGAGFYNTVTPNLIITHCTSVYNHRGVIETDCANALIQYCELGWCWEDGADITGGGTALPYDGDTETLDSCYIHDVSSYNHCDGIQTWGYLTGMTATSILQVNVGDELQSQNTQYITYNNGISIGSTTNGVFAQGDNNVLESNTLFDVEIVMSNEQATSQSQNWTLMNNVVQDNYIYTAGAAPANSNSFISNFNDWYVNTGLTTTPVIDFLTSNPWNNTWAQYQSASKQDANSYGNCANSASPSPNPLFTNVPHGYAQFLEPDLYLNSPTTIYIGDGGSANVSAFAVNDFIEVNWDGVLRQITAVNATNGTIAFTPADTAVTEGYLPTGVADWGASKPASSALNLAFKTGSPAIGHSSTGGNMGSSINLANWMNCDFHGTGRREIPVDPSP